LFIHQIVLWMLRIINIVVLLALVGEPAYAQPANTPIVNIEYKHSNGQKVLLGHCSPAVMQAGIYQEWYGRSYDSYAVEADLSKQLKPLLDGKAIEVFAGSWCGDTRREIPRLMKILETVDFDTAQQLTLIFVDNSKELYKQSPQHEEAGKAIHRIPTIIVYEDGKELNRIVETPVNSLEQDLVDILSGKPYQSNYYAVTYWQQISGVDKKLSAEQLDDLAKAIKGISRNPSEFNGYSYALSAQGRLTEAINVLELNTRLYPADPIAYSNLAKLYVEMGAYREAKEKLEKVLELQRDNEEAKELLHRIASS